MAATKSFQRCDWSGADPVMIRYHDREWGVPVTSDRKLFEFLILEGAQAGLSWRTILNKREGYRDAFAGFNWEKVARFAPRKIRSLLKHPGIVKNRLKIKSTVTNAQAFIRIRDEFGSFNRYQWRFVNHKPIVNRWKAMHQIPARTKESDAFSADLIKRGFKFVGSTIMYAHMQAVGMVNDHTTTCFRYRAVQRLAGRVPTAAK